MSVFGVIQTFIYRFSIGFIKDNLPLMFINSVSRNFLVIFSAIGFILFVIALIYKKKGMQECIDDKFNTIMIIVLGVCILLAIL